MPTSERTLRKWRREALLKNLQRQKELDLLNEHLDKINSHQTNPLFRGDTREITQRLFNSYHDANSRVIKMTRELLDFHLINKEK